MNKLNSISLLLVLLFLSMTVSAQEFGGHPLGLKWQYLNSDAVRVIYPQGMETQAQRIANIINYMDENNTRSVGEKRRRFDMVLQNQTTIPNGYVGLAPLRSEFYATPPQGANLLGSMDWLDVLAIHEYRHVQQNVNANRGLTKLLYLFSGESAWAILSNISIPGWYFEGDAVVAETALTENGRGRTPSFSMEQRALAFAGKDFKYLKHRNGSFKDLLPNRYPLGYLILTHTRNNFGNDIVGDILHDSGRYRGIIYPYARAMRRHTDKGVIGMYNEAWEEAKDKWGKQLVSAKLKATTPVTEKQKRTVTNYFFPRFLSNEKIVAWKNSYQKTDELIALENGNEKRLTTIGLNVDSHFGMGGNLISWVELSQNARRGNQNFSDVVVYDLEKNEKRRLTKKTKFFSPSPSPDGKQIAAVRISPNQENHLWILDAQNGDVLRKLDNPENDFLSRPTWMLDGNGLVFLAKRNNQLALWKIDLRENASTQLTPWTAHVIDAPSVHGSRAYFNASFTGIDNIFYTDLDGSKTIHQVSSVPIGAFEPSISLDGGEVVFTEFTDMGFVVSKQSLGDKNFPEITIVEPVDMPMYQTVANAEEGGGILDKVPTESFDSKKYDGLLRGLKLHSWGFSPSPTTPSLNLQLNNILNDVTITAGGGINLNEDNSQFYNASVGIARYFPVVTMNAARAERQADFYAGGDTLSTQNFNETSFGGSVTVPLTWFNGNYVTSLSPTVGLDMRDLSGIKADGSDLPDNSFGTYNLGLSFSSVRRRARQNVGPRAGIGIDVNYVQSLEDVSNEKITLNGKLYLPGLLPNHNLEIRGGYQKELLSNPYQFSDSFFYPRGYETPVNDDFTSFSVNYGMPLFYPDFGILGITYFKRIRANLFYDRGVGNRENQAEEINYSSAGFEIIFDNQHLNLLPISFGLRQTFLLEDDPLNPKRDSQFTFFLASEF